jgi:quercetin dioxygenase-like cupin family protein
MCLLMEVRCPLDFGQLRSPKRNYLEVRGSSKYGTIGPHSSEGWTRRRIVARRGETIENSLSGERMTFLKTTRDTNGRSFQFEFIAPPGWTVSEHIHPRQEERTEMLSGTLDGRIAGEGLVLSPGEVRVVPPGVAHAWQNSSDEEEARFSVEFSPALNVESGFETTWGLARDGKATKAGVPKNPLQLAVLASEHKDEAYLTNLPIPLQKALVGAISLPAPVGRALGYRANYPEYSGPEQPAGSEDFSSSVPSGTRLAAVAAVLVVLFALLLRRRRRWGST